MPFKKGASGNSDGRKKGSANKVTTELRQRITDFLEGQWSTIEQDFQRLEPEKRVMLFEKLLSFSLPRLSATDLHLTDLEPDSQLAKLARSRMAKLAAEGED